MIAIIIYIEPQMALIQFNSHYGIPTMGHHGDQNKPAADVTESQRRVTPLLVIDTIFVLFCVVQKALRLK